MCGIGGIWQQDGRPASVEQLTAMMAAIAHRGPEGSAWARMANDTVALGFLSLAFTDLPASGLQPLFDEDYQLALLYNGEIYDHEALRDDLIARGHRFRTSSDSEVVLHLYKEYGEEMFGFLNGEFAFAIWDGRTQELFLVRDRFGIKPLLYARHRGAFVFASEAKGLLALDGFPAAIDPRFFTGPGVGVADCAQTAFEGITAVRPGHFMRISKSGETQECYWRPPFGRVPGERFEDARDRLREALVRAVTRRVGGDVPIAMAISSGVDSATIAALTREAGRKLTCFTIAYPGMPYDEAALAEKTATHLGLPFEGVVCTAESLADGFSASIHSTEVASASLSSVSRIAVMAGVRGAGFKAVCSGEGADELFGGYPYFRLEALWRMVDRGGEDAAAAQQALARFGRDEGRSKGVFWATTRGPTNLEPVGYASAYVQRADAMAGRVRWFLSRRCLDQLDGATPLDAVRRELAPYDMHGLDPFDATRVISKGVFGGVVVPLLGDRVEMANSLEGRTPYLDTDVMKVAYSLPEEFCLEPLQGYQKRILRSLSAPMQRPDYAPPEKHNQLSPTFRDFSRTSTGGPLMAEWLSDAAVARAGLLNPWTVRAVRLAWNLTPTGASSFRALDALWGYMLGIQGLHHLFVEGGKPPPPAGFRLETDRSPSTLRSAP